MLYPLFFPFADQFQAFNLFRYITFRSGGAAVTAMLISFLLGPHIIAWLRAKQANGQPIRLDGPNGHLERKRGTPTMGGFLILLALTISTLLWADLTNSYVWIVLLVIVPSMIAAGCFAFIAYLAGNAVFANYLQIHHVSGAGELTVFCGAMVGASLGFLWFNAPPAMVFMGDTGSLAIGAALGTISVVTKHELVLAIVGGLFVLEAVSVIVQVASFRLTGRRVFRMAPLHHHFEQKGWEEPTIVIRFWIIAWILAIAGLATLKLR